MPGSLRAKATSSGKVDAGMDERTTSILGWLATMLTKAKSLMPSYAVCCIKGVTTCAADVPSNKV
ncbi:hypothetical protein D3C77_812350 [compost metagenome]